jgi:hypothetical protein
MPGAEGCWLQPHFMFLFRVVIVFFERNPLDIDPDATCRYKYTRQWNIEFVFNSSVFFGF